MTKVYFWRIEVGSDWFYRGAWRTVEEAKAWAIDYKRATPNAEFTLEVMHVLSSMLAPSK